MNIDALVAIDVHVHLEHAGELTDADKQAQKYFGASAVARDWHGARRLLPLAQDRLRRVSRRRAADRPAAGVERRGRRVRRRQLRHRDRVRQHRSDARRRRRARSAGGWSRRAASAGSSCIRRCSSSRRTIRIAYPLYEVFAEAKLPVLFHTGHSGIGTGMPGGGGIRLKYGNPMLDRRRRGGFSGHADHHGAPVVPVAGRGDLGLPAQAAGLHRSVRLVAEVLLADARSSTPTRC